jgi:hypothetical protein
MADVVNKGIEALSYERYFHGSLTILLQSDIRTHEYDKHAEYAEYGKYANIFDIHAAFKTMSLSNSATVLGMNFSKKCCSCVQMPQWIMK